MDTLLNSIYDVLDAGIVTLTDQKPTEWYEENMIMPRGSAIPGPFSFDHTPYWKEPLDCADPNHPARQVTIMKGAQLGGTAAVLNPLVGYTIAVNPGNVMFLVGNDNLVKGAMLKIDQMINNCNMRWRIGPSAPRRKNSQTGDTNEMKEFAGGYVRVGSVTNHNILRQDDIMIMVVDDYDAALMSSKYAGSTRKLVMQRTNAYINKRKIYWVSSPQLENQSNIQESFHLSDQRYYMLPCPCCSSFIDLQWKIDIDGKNHAGITYKHKNGSVIKSSVGYICQECGEFFTEKHKYDMNLNGFWEPTKKPIEEDHYGYHLSALYAPSNFGGWFQYAQDYVNANPEEGERNEKLHQTFMNLALGQTYTQQGKKLDANKLQKNCRPYDVGTVPEQMSIDDGNGPIVMITCAADLNGKVEDARLDYEIVAWSRSGAVYSIDEGSIGTFIYKETDKQKLQPREKWTYEHNKERSVWSEYGKLLQKTFKTDTGRDLRIICSALDTGYFTTLAYDALDIYSHLPGWHIGVKGESNDKITKNSDNTPYFKMMTTRKDCYIVSGNKVKDDLADYMELQWKEGDDFGQPPNFMNFPIPSAGKYTFKDYFSHFQSERRYIEEKDGRYIGYRWDKKTSISQNHKWDCRYYNIVLAKHIFINKVVQELNRTNKTKLLPIWENVFNANA